MLPEQFKDGNEENILIYHYVEELVGNYKDYATNNIIDEEITLPETPYFLRIGYEGETTQKKLVNLFKVSEGYAAKLLRKFEDKDLIERFEDPLNHRQKIVKLTPKGMKKAENITDLIKNWEIEISSKLTPDELRQLKKLLLKLVIGEIK